MTTDRKMIIFQIHSLTVCDLNRQEYFMEVFIKRFAGLDVHAETIVACVISDVFGVSRRKLQKNLIEQGYVDKSNIENSIHGKIS
jgi:hypothetical protein